MLPSDYPSAPPKGYFLTRIYHPNISKAGEICVNTLKKDWSSDLGIGHVLQARAPLLLRLARATPHRPFRQHAP